MPGKGNDSETACTMSLAFFLGKWTSTDKQRHGNQIVLPTNLHESIIKLAHDQPLARHLGTEKKTPKKSILRSFYWPGISHEVSDNCSSLDVRWC